MKIAIIGGGPSGLTAAYYAKNSSNEVCVFEKNNDVLKKLLLTGNGKCNYWNMEEDIKYFHSYNNELLKDIITLDNLNKAFNFTKEIGIVPKVKNNCFYPFSGKSSSVKSLLKKACIERNVIFKTNTDINNIEYRNNKFNINGYEFDKVVIATGSKAYPKTGSDGFGYELAKKFNHTINQVNPSLVQLVTNTNLEKQWAGIRCDVVVEYFENTEFRKREVGEIQFTDYGLSGICIFNLSRDIKIGLNNNKKEEIKINFIPWFNKSEEEFIKYLDDRNNSLSNRTLTELCDGFIDYNLVNIILKHLKLKDNNWNDYKEDEKKLIVNNLKEFSVNIVDTKGFDNSQTCSGGISLNELDTKTFASLKQKGLYFCGEIIDVDGDCGGYNLTFAFLSGMLVGTSIGDENA